MNKNDLNKIRGAVSGEFFHFESTASTNTEALRHTEAPDKSLFYAENQTGGRGRRGKRWESSEGGIYMTILLKPSKVRGDFSALTLATGLAVARVVPNSQIKWPNDIILGGKKSAGILVETEFIGEKAVVAVGIGINANNTEFPKEISENATSIYLFSGKKQDKAGLIVEVYNEFFKVYEDFQDGFDKIRDEYSKKCVTLNREIAVLRQGGTKTMYAVGIGRNGELLAEADGKTERINFGEVSVRNL